MFFYNTKCLLQNCLATMLTRNHLAQTIHPPVTRFVIEVGGRLNALGRSVCLSQTPDVGVNPKSTIEDALHVSQQRR